MENKKYQLKTLKEIINVVNENNLKNFLIDFQNWLSFKVGIKKVIKALSKETKESIEIELDESFIWIDDGKTGGKITMPIIKDCGIKKREWPPCLCKNKGFDGKPCLCEAKTIEKIIV